MGDNMRPLDLAILLAILAAVVVIVGASTPARAETPLPGPLTVDDATVFFLDTPVLVSGYLVKQSSKTYLCDAPRCPGARLAVVGPTRLARPRRVVVAGVVTGDEIAPLRLPGRRHTAAL
jgi:hypothetical protein